MKRLWAAPTGDGRMIMTRSFCGVAAFNEMLEHAREADIPLAGGFAEAYADPLVLQEGVIGDFKDMAASTALSVVRRKLARLDAKIADRELAFREKRRIGGDLQDFVVTAEVYDHRVGSSTIQRLHVRALDKYDAMSAANDELTHGNVLVRVISTDGEGRDYAPQRGYAPEHQYDDEPDDRPDVRGRSMLQRLKDKLV
jgi:hypothetical protein